MKKKLERKEKQIILPPVPADLTLTVPPIVTDPLGSYTGRPLQLQEQPVQDADDL